MSATGGASGGTILRAEMRAGYSDASAPEMECAGSDRRQDADIAARRIYGVYPTTIVTDLLLLPTGCLRILSELSRRSDDLLFTEVVAIKTAESPGRYLEDIEESAYDVAHLFRAGLIEFGYGLSLAPDRAKDVRIGLGILTASAARINGQGMA